MPVLPGEADPETDRTISPRRSPWRNGKRLFTPTLRRFRPPIRTGGFLHPGASRLAGQRRRHLGYGATCRPAQISLQLANSDGLEAFEASQLVLHLDE